MSDLFRKLNLKDHATIVVLDAPTSLEPALATLAGVTVMRKVPATGGVVFALAFVRTLAAVERVARDVVPRLEGDAILWCAYPKASSKRYACDFNRDTGWASLGGAGLEPVRGVAIDEDWSGLRFRRVEYIATLRRAPARALSAAGRAKASRTSSSRP
ncbi:hypothetical protein TBR22_A44100 [Luteitalea sp. TBR-22]|uniref:hypothetical protein n=1 Tax=Luteitalea sp. TBR-22 TaxID=2802971 RepID=UPI001AF78026|nr:hypothetical protein [Luteitalea sp. TBR-22]BCS35183.1 hypothetical protein TBR22_A44100 [Luteitalea sp. TBR-22]